MWQYALKVLITAVVVVAVAEIGKRSSFWGALIASLPLTSLLAFVWIYLDTGDTQVIANLSRGIFWLVLASLPLFVVLPALLTSGKPFWLSMAVATLVTAGAYLTLIRLLAHFGVRV
jgi:hypothetical protein